MTLTDNEKKVHDIFGIHLGREANAGGLDYWSGQLDSGKSAADANTPSYLTSDDLTAWWDGIDKSSWTKQEDSKPKPMNDFMKMMMFMSVLNPRQSGNLSQLGSMFGQFN